jgi:hypothetical protein
VQVRFPIKLQTGLLVACGIAAGILSVFPGQERLMLAFLALLAVGGLIVRNPPRAVLVILFLLPLIGFIRRLLISVTGMPAYDPLVLIAPAASSVLFMAAIWKYPQAFKSTLSWLVCLLMIIFLYQMANPLQGGILVGLAGALFFITPLFWFFIGKRYGNFNSVERIIIALGLICGLYGLWQNFVGFFPFEEAWVDSVRDKYVTLVAYDKIRAFSTFPSVTEFINFMAVVLLLCCSKLIFKDKNWFFFVLLGAISLACIMYAGIRGVVVMLVLSTIVVYSVRHYRRPFKIILSVSTVFLLVFLFITIAGQVEFSEESAPLIEHLIGGLTEPLNPQKSSLLYHLDSLVRGIITGSANPLGFGLGSTNLAGSKFGGINMSTEIDLTDILLATGWSGGIIAFIIVAVTIFQAARLNMRYPGNRRYFLALWILLYFGGHWLNGGNYFLTSLVWLLVGWLDQQYCEIGRPEAGAMGSDAGESGHN